MIGCFLRMKTRLIVVDRACVHCHFMAQAIAFFHGRTFVLFALNRFDGCLTSFLYNRARERATFPNSITHIGFFLRSSQYAFTLHSSVSVDTTFVSSLLTVYQLQVFGSAVWRRRRVFKKDGWMSRRGRPGVPRCVHEQRARLSRFCLPGSLRRTNTGQQDNVHTAGGPHEPPIMRHPLWSGPGTPSWRQHSRPEDLNMDAGRVRREPSALRWTSRLSRWWLMTRGSTPGQARSGPAHIGFQAKRVMG